MSFPLIPDSASTFVALTDPLYWALTIFVLLFSIGVPVVMIVLGGAGAYYLSQALATSPVFPCISQEGGRPPGYHWHTSLSIFSGVSKVTIPASIGLSAFCTEPIHTHDISGTIHIETDGYQLHSIGDFFAVWKKPFDSPTQMLVNGTAVTPSPSVIMYNQETIELRYTSFTP